MTLYGYLRCRPLAGVDPSGFGRIPWGGTDGGPRDMAELITGCRYARPPRYADDGDAFSGELLACLFWLESSHRPDAGNPDNGPYGLGQMTPTACADVDERFLPGLPAGECWDRQTSGDACHQIGNSDAYLLIVYRDYCNRDIRCALRRYGGWATDGSQDSRYVDRILNCEGCLKRKKPPGGSLSDISDCDAQNCFDKMN
jgi:hypothetical protein